MLTQYIFNADTAELLWEVTFSEPGVCTTVRHKSSPGCEQAEITVKEGADAEREMLEWRQSLEFDQRIFNTQTPDWLFWYRD